MDEESQENVQSTSKSSPGIFNLISSENVKCTLTTVDSQQDSNAVVSHLDYEPISCTLDVTSPSSRPTIASLSPRNIKNLNKRDFRGETHMHLCARKGDISTCQKLVNEGADVNLADNAGWTPLHEACSYGFYEMVEFLINHNADINKASSDGVCPLHDAVQSRNAKLVWLLLKHGANRTKQSLRGQLPSDLNNEDVKEIDELLNMTVIPDIYPYDEKVDEKSEKKSISCQNDILCNELSETLDSKSVSQIDNKKNVEKPSKTMPKKEIIVRKVSTKPLPSLSLTSSVLSSSKPKKRSSGVLNILNANDSQLLKTSAAINDVYEFHSSPESSGAASPLLILPPISSTVLQKPPQSSDVLIAPMFPLESTMTTSAFVTFPALPTTDAVANFSSTLSSTTTSTTAAFLNTNFKPGNDDFSSFSLQKSQSSFVTNISSGSPAPKRIKTATLAKELLAAAAAVSASPSLNTTLISTPPITTASVANSTLILEECNKLVQSSKKSNAVDSIDENIMAIDDIKDNVSLEEVFIPDDNNKKVPPLRILLPKTSCSEDDSLKNVATTSELLAVGINSGIDSIGLEYESSSGSCSGAQSPQSTNATKCLEASESVATVPDKKIKFSTQTDKQSSNEELVQQRLTRSRVRQTGAIISDDITSYPTNSTNKRKAGNSHLRRGLPNKREKSAAHVSETLIGLTDGAGSLGLLELNEKNSLQSSSAAFSSTVDGILNVDNENGDIAYGDEECSRLNFLAGKHEEYVEDDQETNVGDEETNLKESVASQLFSKNNFESSLEFNTIIKEKWTKEYSREIMRLDKEEVVNCIDTIANTYRSQHFAASKTLLMQLNLENESLKIRLPSVLEKLHNEHVRRRKQMRNVHYNENEKLIEHGVREYFRMYRHSTERTSPAINVVRLLRDMELYDPFAPNLLTDDSNFSSNVATEMQSVNNFQILKRLKIMSSTMKNRQTIEAHALYVNQLAEWQKAVQKFNRQQQKQQQEQQVNGKNGLSELTNWKIIDNNQINAIVQLVNVKEATFPFKIPDQQNINI